MSTPKPWEHAKAGEGSATDALAAGFVESLSYDTRLYDADIRGSLAHAEMLCGAGLISANDLSAIRRGLGEIRAEIEAAPAGPTAFGVPGAWAGWRVELEDVHMCIESALVAKVGDPGRKLHTGRSRNDQVAVDLRLWLVDACHAMSADLMGLCGAFRAIAQEQGEIPLTTYTHMQRAQPGCVGAECLAWFSMFERDARAFAAMPENPLGLGASPLGAGAVAGSILALDRGATAAALGFAGVAPSSIDATASRDEALDFLYAAARTGVHLSRLAEQWILYASTEFGFLTLAEAYTTGSSMMPQKRNPDMLELIRGRSGNLNGSLVALLTICKGLPLAYNRDLQEDKRHVFAAHDTLRDCLRMATRVVTTARFRPGSITPTLERGFLDATALAEYFVLKGVPFRTAHQIVGALVRVCEDSGRGSLRQLTLEEIRGASGLAGPDVFEFLGAENVIRKYRTLGHAGTGPGGYADLLGISRGSEGVSAARAASEPAASLFGLDAGAPARESEYAEVIAEYERIGRTLDDLPYTEEFDRLHALAGGAGGGGAGGAGITKQALLRKLHNLRKAGKLPKVGKSAALPVKLEPEEERWLGNQVVEVCGSLGQRDQLPYDQRFDRLVEAFNARTGREVSPHTVWRLIAKLAK